LVILCDGQAGELPAVVAIDRESVSPAGSFTNEDPALAVLIIESDRGATILCDAKFGTISPAAIIHREVGHTTSRHLHNRALSASLVDEHKLLSRNRVRMPRCHRDGRCGYLELTIAMARERAIEIVWRCLRADCPVTEEN
jgi:hypothetical protein